MMSEGKQTQVASLTALERRNESLKSQLQESQISERLANQNADNSREHLEEVRSRLVSARLSPPVTADFISIFNKLQFKTIACL